MSHCLHQYLVGVAEAVDEFIRSKRYVERSKYGSKFDTCVPDGCVVDRVVQGCYDIAFAYAVFDEVLATRFDRSSASVYVKVSPSQIKSGLSPSAVRARKTSRMFVCSISTPFNNTFLLFKWSIGIWFCVHLSASPKRGSDTGPCSSEGKAARAVPCT